MNENQRELVNEIETQLMTLVVDEKLTNKNINAKLRAMKTLGRLTQYKIVHIKHKEFVVKDIYVQFPSEIEFIKINMMVEK